MKAFFIACLLLILSHFARAQAPVADFGNIDPSELQLKECPFEKGAAAMNLLKTAKIGMDFNQFSGVLTLTTEYRVRIKIFNKSGFSAANIRIPFAGEGRSTRIKDIEAYIYSLDAGGKVTREKVEKKEIFQNRSRSTGSLNYISFTFPDLYDGAVLEYKYTRIDRNSLSIQPWFFQDELPTAFSRVVTVIPAYAYLTYRAIVSDKMEKDSAYKKHYNSINNEEIVSFTLRNVHSFRPEPFMFSLNDNLQRVEFSLSPRTFLHSSFVSNEGKMKYQNLSLLRSPFFGYQFDRPIPGVDSLIDSVKKMPHKQDRIAALYTYIRQNVEFNGEQTFFCDSIEGCLKLRSGSSAEMNILLLNLLRRSGINCLPLLVSTHENGNPDLDFPSMAQFNGVDVMVREHDRQKDLSPKDRSTESQPIAGLAIDTVAVENAAPIGDTLIRKIGFHYTPASTGTIYFVNPFLFLGFKKNPFIDSVRYTDVDFGCNQSFTTRMRIKLAGNFSLETQQGDRDIWKQDSSISFKRKVFMEGDYLIVESSFLLNNTIFIKEDYASLKSFFDKFYAIQNEDIPLKKRG